MKRFLPLIVLAVIAVTYFAYKRYLNGKPFEWAGTVEARDVTVGSRTGGRIAKISVQEGDHVNAGQVLIQLEPGDLTAQRGIADAQLQQMQAAYEKLKKGARPEEIAQANARAAQANASLAETRHGSRVEDIATGEARVAQFKAEYDKAVLDASRSHRLLATGAIAKAEADTSDTNLAAAQAQLDAQQRGLDELRAGARVEEKQQATARAQEADAAAKLVLAGARVEDLQAGEAQVAAAKARVDQLDVMIGELVIRAPNAARVEALDLRPGDILAPNAPAAVLLEDGQLYVRIYVPETEIGHIKVGDTVPISVDSFGSRAFEGKVEHIDEKGQYSPRNLQTADERADQVFAARIGLVEGKDLLRAGMSALIHVPK
jgi:HlyD family secretion protein